ncbi:MAG: MFS transporter, partial [Propionibacteriaceae bacterium]|nr:MFS transporter [Propionibacteriaceae bacterium]
QTKPRRVQLGRPFGVQLASTGLANLGDGILGTLAPLLALSLTSSPMLISALTAATWLPWLLFGLVAGVIVDRVDRRRAQVAALLARAALLGSAAWLTLVGLLSIPLLIALLMLYGLTEVVADLGATAMVPDLVPPDRLPAANGRVIGVQQVANTFLGAPLVGVLIVLGAGLGFGVSAGLAALAGLLLLVGLKGDFRRASSGPTRPWAQVREGLAFLVRHRVLRPLVITGSVLNLAASGYFAVFVLWVVGPESAVGLTETQYPLVMLGLAVGAVAGSLVAAAFDKRFGTVRTMIGAFIASVLLMVAPVVWPTPVSLVLSCTLVGVTNTVGNVLSQSLRQRLVPGDLLGRIGGAGRTLSYGLMPLGALLAGALAEHAGLPVTFYAAVALSLLACGYLALRLRAADVPDQPAVVAAGAAS